VIRLIGVGHEYGRGTPWRRRALEGLDLVVDEGERVVVAGDNGSGKSTLAWILAGLTRPTEGRALLDGEVLTNCVGRVGLAFQHARLQLFRPTVAEDVGFGTTLDDDGVDHALRLVGLEPSAFRDRRVDDLSGGELRRVALAGLLGRRPRLLILDEPLAGLDEDARASLVDLLRLLGKDGGRAMVVVSHDLVSAPAFADRVLTLERGRIARDECLA
jgi:energy-coupling factor transport system ATP-binding protein